MISKTARDSATKDILLPLRKKKNRYVIACTKSTMAGFSLPKGLPQALQNLQCVCKSVRPGFIPHCLQKLSLEKNSLNSSFIMDMTLSSLHMWVKAQLKHGQGVKWQLWLVAFRNIVHNTQFSIPYHPSHFKSAEIQHIALLIDQSLHNGYRKPCCGWIVW